MTASHEMHFLGRVNEARGLGRAGEAAGSNSARSSKQLCEMGPISL